MSSRRAAGSTRSSFILMSRAISWRMTFPPMLIWKVGVVRPPPFGRQVAVDTWVHHGRCLVPPHHHPPPTFQGEVGAKLVCEGGNWARHLSVRSVDRLHLLRALASLLVELILPPLELRSRL